MKKKISNSSSKFTEIPLEKCRVRLFIFCLFLGKSSIWHPHPKMVYFGHVAIQVKLAI
jgi:hypothetical protein